MFHDLSLGEIAGERGISRQAVHDLVKRSTNFSATGTGPMTVQHMEGSGTDIDLAVRTQSFFDASLKLTYNFKLFNRVNLDLSAGVSNIFNSYQNDFDLGPTRDSGYIYGPALPRCINAGVSISL